MLLCIDIGGTAVKLGLVQLDGAIRARYETSVSFDGYRTPILTTVVREARAFVARENIMVRGIGVSATGQIDDRTGVVIGTNGKIPGYEGSPIRAELEEAFGVPVHVLNDANAAALGECFVGRARGLSDVIMLTLGTGVGGGIVIGGKLYGGARGIAGELGHFTLYQDGVPCPCGKRGCLESYASTTALLHMAREAAHDETLDGRAFFARVGRGDRAMQAVLEHWTSDVAAGITGLVHIFNPEMVLLGGGVSEQEALFVAPLRTRVLRGVMPRFAEGLRIERAILGNDAGMIGAARFWLDRQMFAAP